QCKSPLKEKKMNERSLRRQSRPSTNVVALAARRHATLRWCACAAVAGINVARLATAADITWVGAPATPLSFGVGANWAGGAVPDSPDNAVINNAGIATVATGFTRTVTDLHLGTA